MHRRSFLLSLSSLGLSLGPTTAVAAKTAGQVFNIKWRNLDVGYSSINLTKNGSQIIVKTDVKINVSFFGIEFFSYSLNSKEIWRNKRLRSLKSEVSMGEKREFSKVQEIPEGYKVEGSSFSGIVLGNPGTTSYFTPEFLSRSIWISTQNGKPLKIKSRKIGIEKIISPLGTINATNWEISGDLNINLFYRDDEWVGSRFKVGGSVANFILHKKVGRINELWSKS